MKTPKYILSVIVISQFFCTSLWFAGNGVMSELISAFYLSESALGHLTSAVQFGFICGTLTFAILTISDRYSPSKVFFVSALLGAGFNLGAILQSNTIESLLIFRFLTGFFLAGIYPVGMKIAADYYKEGLGKSLGYLVGALVLGTALPHWLNDISFQVSWKSVIYCTSILSVIGGATMLFVPNGPHRKKSQNFNPSAFLKVFRNRKFRSAAFGYFGHMWELYAFWAFVPIVLANHVDPGSGAEVNTSVWSFFIIGIGGVSCVMAGYISRNIGEKKTALVALGLSGLCCLLSPLIFTHAPFHALIAFLLFWGSMVIADSPMFSTMVAHNAEAKIKGTALTIVNCIGFAITIVSIQVINYLTTILHSSYLLIFLVVGPMIGWLFLVRS